ncbi:YbhN family protein [Thermodesulfobacteriota bacterium]
MITNITIKRIVRFCISFIIIGGLIYYLWRHWDTFYIAIDASWYHILSLALCILVTWVLSSCQFLLFLRKTGLEVGFWENMLLFIATALGNYLPMRFGSLLRMRYFKQAHGLRYGKFGGIMGVRTLILLISTGILGCIGMVGLNLSGFSLNVTVLAIFISMVVISLCAYLIPAPRLKNPENFFLKVWSDLFAGLRLIQSQPVLLWQVVVLVLMQMAMLAIRLYITFSAIQVELSPWALLVLAPSTVLISFLSLTPGNLALREWAIGLISLAAGLDFSSGIFAGTLDRAVLLACIFFFGSVSLIYIYAILSREKS